MSSTSDSDAALEPVTGWQLHPRTQTVVISLFVFARLVTLLALPLEGLRGYGDFTHFFRLAQIPGWPYLDYWSEFPPLFPFLSSLLFRITGGQEHVFDYLLVFILSTADVGSLILFLRLIRRLHSPEQTLFRLGLYLLVLAVLPYCWWYFDPLAVFFMLLGLTFFQEGKNVSAGLALGAGALIKFFPALVLVWAWRRLPRRRAALVTGITLGLVILVYSGLYLLSPRFTMAGLQSQASKGSWETIWALLDGNDQTGNFGPLVERLDPSKALVARGNPARIPPFLTVILAGGLGLWAFFQTKKQGDLAGLSLVGLTWAVFLLWSPGWSPQWVLYLLPLILLALPDRLVLLLGGAFVLVNLMEWPVLLSRGMFSLLAAPVLLRTLLLVLLAGLFFRQAKTGELVKDRREISRI